MNTLLGEPADATFGKRLRHWRTARRMSQLALATEAGISTRHLSFLETGRAQPSREMATLLAGVLELPHPERNALLVGAGYAPIHEEPRVAAPAFAPARRFLEYTLRQQEPFPAFVMNGQSDIVMRNHASRRIFDAIRGPVPEHQPINAFRTVFHPHGLRPYIVNWDEQAECMLQSLQREIAVNCHVANVALREELLSYPGVPSRFRAVAPSASASPVVNLRLRKGDLSLAFFSADTTLVHTRDVAAEELRIKCYFPADDVTERFARHLASTHAVAM